MEDTDQIDVPLDNVETNTEPPLGLTDRLSQIEADIRAIHNGTHIGYKNALELIEIEYEEALERAQLFKEYQLYISNRVYMMECNHADQELQNDMEQVWEEMMDSIDLRKRRVRDEYESFDSTIVPGFMILLDPSKMNITTRKQTRLNQKEERKRGRKPPTATLDFQLKENEMYEDLWVLRKVLMID